jgi:hypothetical protein
MSNVLMHPTKIKTNFGAENVSNVVNESAELDSIKQAIDEMGLKPIWLQLIRQFGSDMYLKGIQAGRSMQEPSDHGAVPSRRAVAPSD